MKMVTLVAGVLEKATFTRDPIFGVEVPDAVPEVPAAVLSPRGTWPDAAAYDAQAAKLAGMFRENFRQFESQVDAKVKEAGPR
jgi:phosphoenolpyruvate carboxykinase (ATP)